MLTLFDLSASLLAVSAVFAVINRRFVRLPNSVGVLVMALIGSVALIGLDRVLPDARLLRALTDDILRIDFSDTVLRGMLAFLLFASALHVDLANLRSRALTIGFLASVGVMISTAIVGYAFWLACLLWGVPIMLIWAGVFGALISPTDAVAVFTTLKTARMPQATKMEITGEALLNDGVGVVLFTVLAAAAVSPEGKLDLGHGIIARAVLFEGVGGVVLGLVTGYVAYLAIKASDDASVAVLISIALVMGTYTLADKIAVSGPISVVAAGLLIGRNASSDAAASPASGQSLFGFWKLIDDILNSLLFVLIGLEVLVLRSDLALIPIAMIAIPVVLIGRFVSVAIPVAAFGRFLNFPRGTIPVLTWGGVRGGISVALALSLPESNSKPVLLAATYAVVLFSIIVQGLTLGPFVRRMIASSP